LVIIEKDINSHARQISLQKDSNIIAQNGKLWQGIDFITKGGNPPNRA
jgi:hypothetical protein